VYKVFSFFNKKKINRWLLVITALIIVVVAFAIHVSRGSVKEGNKWVPVKHGPFRIELIESGEIRAVNSYFIEAPMEWEMELQIIDMAPEGIHVNEGDFLIKFDISKYEERLELEKDMLAQAEMEIRRVEKEHESQMSELQSQVQMARYSKEAAEMKIEQLKFESEISKEEARLELQKSIISLDETTKKIIAQEITDSMNLHKVTLDREQSQKRVDDIRKRIEEFTVIAPTSGMVVYQKIGGWNSPLHKVEIGDKPRPREAVISISDLLKMEMVAQVNELDVNKLTTGQKAVLRLDAFSESVFHGTVTKVAQLVEKKQDVWTHRHGGASPVKEPVTDIPTFQVLITIEGQDQILKPGMTVQATILLEEMQDALFVPLGVVYEREDGNPVVFTKKDYPKPIPVKLGKRNEQYVTIEGAIKKGDMISLAPPTGYAHPLGWFAEMQRRKSELKELIENIDAMNKLGLTKPSQEQKTTEQRMQTKPQEAHPDGANPPGERTR